MQLQKRTWKKTRNSARYIQPNAQGYYMARSGRQKTSEEMSAQKRSRLSNPQDSLFNGGE